MSSRKRRHTRSTFSDLVHPNFEELSREFPDFGRALQVVRQQQKESGGSFASNVTQEFSIATTRGLLHTYFSLSLPRIPTLCPPVPNRYFFVRWISKDLLPLMHEGSYFEPVSDQRVAHRKHYGVDLGTGATCIYPLLFLAPKVQLEDHDSTMSTDWRWLASEVNQRSVEDAKQNVVANRLESKIKVVHVSPTDCQEKDASTDTKDQMTDDVNLNNQSQAGPLLRLLEALPQEARPTGVVDVVMTNPPFHDPESERVTQPLREGDHRPRTDLTNQEASYPGGEASFVIDIVVDSLRLMPSDSSENGQPTMSALWFASMFGKKTSWNQLRGALTYMLGPARVQATEFGPGHLTRWFLAWTYCKPKVRSPLALFQRSHGNTKAAVSRNRANQPHVGCLASFDVPLRDENDIARGAVNEVLDRVVTYFRTLRSYTLTVEVLAQKPNSGTATVAIREETPHVEEWNEKELPARVLNALHARHISFMDMLPREGHFVMDVSIRANSTTTATVSAKAYVHSPYGRHAAEKMESQFQGEVCRTTRRWRRLLERQQRQQAQQQEEEQPQQMES